MTSTNDDERPLLFLDTGVGGFSVLRASQQLLPDAPVVYAADYAGLPYGMKTEAELATRIPALLGRLVERYHPRLATIACNTASTIALDHVRAVLNIPVVGTVPAIKPASEMTRTGVIGLLGTQATIRQPYVDNLASEFAVDKRLIRFGAPDLVYAAEAKLRGETPDADILEQAISGLLEQPGGEEIDVIVLACTHFPLVEQELTAIIGRPMQFIDGAAGIARRIAHLTEEMDWPDVRQPHVFVTTGDISGLDPYRAALDEHGFGAIERL